MTEGRVEVVARDGDTLGEGPHWDLVTGRLLRVDIEAGRVWRLDPATGRAGLLELGVAVGFAIPRVQGGLVLGLEHAIVLLDAEDRQERVLCAVEPDAADNRVNDGKVDARGRLWFGTLSRSRSPGTAALYRLEPDGTLARVLDGLTIANGTGWSQDGETLYFIDSTTQRVDVFAYDEAAGTLSERRPFAAVDPADGLPDGLTVDAEGGVWVALFGGGAVRRYAPDGTLDRVVAIPTSNPTSVAFGGGPDLETLYVTTARRRLDPVQLAAQPLAGAVLSLVPGVRGRPAHPFGG